MNEVDGETDADGVSHSEFHCGGGRPAAGEDPAKREQILDGAHRVFMRLGFDAASMNDITREAGVSKGTLYVYFKNKEDLFVAIIERQKIKIYEEIENILKRDQPVADTLYEFGMLFATHMLSNKTIRACRTIIGVVDRMPQLGNLFMATGSKSGPAMIANYIKLQAEKGRLKDIDDPMLSSRQFGDLCLAGLFRPRLLGELTEEPSAERIKRNVTSAVRLFLNTYGVKTPSDPA